MGENGAGKCTLIRILAGAVAPDGGAIALDGAPVSIASAQDAHRLGLRFIHQELNVAAAAERRRESSFSAAPIRRRSAASSTGARCMIARARRSTGFGVADIAPGTIIGRLPVGDRMLVKIAATFLEDAVRPPARLFVMDEPTAALTGEESERLFEVIAELKRRGCGVALRLAPHRRGAADLPTASRCCATARRARRSTRRGARRTALIELMTGRGARKRGRGDAPRRRAARRAGRRRASADGDLARSLVRAARGRNPRRRRRSPMPARTGC